MDKSEVPVNSEEFVNNPEKNCAAVLCIIAPVMGESECRRMVLLRKSTRDTGSKCFAQLRRFCLKVPLSKDKTEFRKAVDEMISEIEKNFKDEMELMYREENLAGITNTLDGLVDESRDKTDVAAWRPSGNVTSDLAAYRIHAKRQQVARLTEMHERLLRDNQQLLQSVLPLRLQFLSAKKNLADHCTKINRAYAVCKELDIDELAA